MVLAGNLPWEAHRRTALLRGPVQQCRQAHQQGMPAECINCTHRGSGSQSLCSCVWRWQHHWQMLPACSRLHVHLACESASTAAQWIAHAKCFRLPSILLRQCADAAAHVQGMAVKVRLSNVKAGNHEMLDGITRVLTDGNYTLAARALSTKIKSHRRTPVQQAGGERPSQHSMHIKRP